MADRAKRWFAAAGVAVLLVSAPVSADEITVMFGQGPGPTRHIRFDDFSGDETWYLTRCQNAFAIDYHIVIREYGDAEQIQPVNSALEADRTVCVAGHIPDIVKRYMR